MPTPMAYFTMASDGVDTLYTFGGSGPSCTSAVNRVELVPGNDWQVAVSHTLSGLPHHKHCQVEEEGEGHVWIIGGE